MQVLTTTRLPAMPRYLRQAEAPILLLVLSGALLTFAMVAPPAITGDGWNYFAMAMDIAHRGRPDLSPETRAYLESLGSTNFLGMVTWSESGRGYHWHFWFYPALCAPALKLLEALGSNPLRCFQLTNSIICIALTIFIAKQSLTSKTLRISVWCIFALSTGQAYLQWSSPELFSAAFILMSCFCFASGRNRGATLFAMISSLQNPTSALLVIPYALDLVLKTPGFRSSKADIIELLYKLTGLAAISTIALLPSIWNLVTIGEPSVIVRRAIYTPLMDVERLISFLFDFNLGLIWGLPSLLFLIPTATILAIINRPSRIDLLVVGFFLVITPTLAQVNWNSASAMMSRYAAWSGMILVFWSIYRIMQARQIATFAATAAVTLQAFAAYHYGGPLVRHQLSSVRFTPLAEFFLAHYPQRYNPELEVFYERLFGSEASRPPTPYKFVNSDGAITKILTLSTRLGYVDEDVCGPQASLAPRSAINTARIRGPFIYINGLFSCVSTDRLDFSLAQGQTRGLSLVRGWSDSEPTGTWTIGPRATLKIDASPEIQPKDLEIEGLGFFGGVHDHVWIEIKVNGHIARRASLTSAAASFNERIGIPEPDRNPSAPIEIDITIRSPAIPASLGVSNDPRELGIFVRRVSLYSAHGTSAALGDKTIDRPEMAR